MFLDSKAPKSRENHAKNRYRFVWEQDVAGSNPVIPTKKEKALYVAFSFLLGVPFEAVLRSKMQVHIPRTEIEKLASQAKCVGITQRSEVTLSFRPNLLLTAPQILRVELRSLTIPREYGILSAEEKLDTG